MGVSAQLGDALFEHFPLGITVWRLVDVDDDASLVLVQGNRCAARLLNRELSPLYGTRMGEALPGTTPRDWSTYANVVREGTTLDLPELRYSDVQVPEGQFALRGYALPSRHLCLIIENVSALRLAEEDASKHSLFLDSILEHLPAMVFVKDAEQLRFERMNKAGEDLLGLSREDLLGKDDYAFFPPAQAAFFQAADRETLKGGRILEIAEESIQTSQGQRWLYTRKIPIVGPEGPEHLLGVSIDITTRKRAQQALERAEANFRTLVEHCPDAIFAQRHGEIAFANPAFVRLLGFRPHEPVVGRPVASVLHPDDLDQEKARCFVTGDSAYPAMELRCVQRSGEVIDVEATGVTCEFDGESAVVSVLRDVTMRRRAEAALRESQEELEQRVQKRTAELLRARAVLQQEVDTRGRAEAALQQREEQLRQALKMEAVGRLAGGVAHDFNNLLTVILSYGDLLLPQVTQSSPVHEGLEEITRAATRAADLTRQLLAFSRRQVLEPRVVDLNTILTGTQRLLRRLIGEDLELRVLPAADLKRARIDPGQIEQVIMNLVVNARDAMPSGGALTIETQNVVVDELYATTQSGLAPGTYVALIVSDTGLGMDKQTQQRVFEPFFTTKEQGKGTGLGLSTVYGIVQQSGGNIWVYSEPGRGTTFKVYFPALDDAADELTQAAALQEPGRGSETILLVEDEDQVRILVRGVLRRQGYRVLDARTPAEAIGISEQYDSPIDLLLTDVVMPQMSGGKLAGVLRPQRPSMRVLYISGYTDHTIIHHGVLDASIAFLQKPLTPSTLLRKVREVLEASSEPTDQVRG